METTTIFLSTAFNVGSSKVPTSRKDIRVNQYKKGFNRFFERKEKIKDLDLIISDNTISRIDEVDSEILNEIPNDSNYKIKFDFEINNRLGSINKGAGIIVSWKRNIETIKNNKYILHFEPRLYLKDFSFIDDYLSNPRNLFTLGSNKKHFNTGLFAIESCHIIDFLKNVDLEKMTKEKESLEYVLFNYVKQNNIKFDERKRMGVIWHDSFKDVNIEM